MKVKIENTNHAAWIHHASFEPGDGTCYDIVVFDDPYGGELVVWPNHSTWRYYHNDQELKFLHGKKCKYTQDAILRYMIYRGH